MVFAATPDGCDSMRTIAFQYVTIRNGSGVYGTLVNG